MLIIKHKRDPNFKQCILCEETADHTTECETPYSKGHGGRQWLQICEPCAAIIEADPQEFATVDSFGWEDKPRFLKADRQTQRRIQRVQAVSGPIGRGR